MKRQTATMAKKQTTKPPSRGILQRAAVRSAPEQDVPPIVHEVLRSRGQPLDHSTRAFMESRFDHDFSRVQVHAKAEQPQTKPSIGQQGDKYEQEADRMVAQVVQTSASDNSVTPGDFRSKYNFSKVRVHTNQRAAQSARTMNAVAYTVGQDVVFGAGQYTPGTVKGQGLLSHELTHVIQQTTNPNISPWHLQRAGFFESIARFFGGGTFSEEELQNYLALLRDNGSIEDHYDSDNKAREVVRRWQSGDASFSILDVPIRILLIQEMASGFLSADDQNAILNLLSDSITSELITILTEVNISMLSTRFGGARRERLEQFLTQHEGNEELALLGGEWTANGIMEILHRHGDQHIIESIISQGYTIIRFETAFDKWRYDDGRVEEQELLGLRGNTVRSAKEIRIRESLSNEIAASVLYHEVSHVTSAQPDYLEQEIEVRVSTEEFNIRHGLPETSPGYRNPDGTVNEALIRQQIMGSPHYNPTGRERIGRRYVGEENVPGWHLP